jgi:hypothetical protein
VKGKEKTPCKDLSKATGTSTSGIKGKEKIPGKDLNEAIGRSRLLKKLQKYLLLVLFRVLGLVLT